MRSSVAAYALVLAVSTWAVPLKAQDASSSELADSAGGLLLRIGEKEKTAQLALAADLGSHLGFRASVSAPLDADTREAMILGSGNRLVPGFGFRFALSYDSIRMRVHNPGGSDAPGRFDYGLRMDGESETDSDATSTTKVGYEAGLAFALGYDRLSLRDPTDISADGEDENKFGMELGLRGALHWLGNGVQAFVGVLDVGVSSRLGPQASKFELCRALPSMDPTVTGTDCSSAFYGQEGPSFSDSLSAYVRLSLIGYLVETERYRYGVRFGISGEQLGSASDSDAIVWDLAAIASPRTHGVPLLFGVGLRVTDSLQQDEVGVAPYITVGASLYRGDS